MDGKSLLVYRRVWIPNRLSQRGGLLVFYTESQIIFSSVVSLGQHQTTLLNRSSLLEDRLKLLVHILCELKDSHGVTADKLREAGQDVRRQITPAHRLQVLDEIYFVREMEEKYLDGDLGMHIYAFDAYSEWIRLIGNRCKRSPPGYSHPSPRGNLSGG